jgi:hypothetical protein
MNDQVPNSALNRVQGIVAIDVSGGVQRYASLRQAAKALGIAPAALSYALKRAPSVTADHYVMLVANYDSGAKPVDWPPITMQVECIETGTIFESPAAAGRYLRARRSTASAHTIQEACEGRRKTAGGLHWRYLRADPVPMVSWFDKPGPHKRQARPVVAIAPDGSARHFASRNAAARALGIPGPGISLALTGRRPTCHGLRWLYADVYAVAGDTAKPLRPRKVRTDVTGKTARPVTLEDASGQSTTFASVRAAASSAGVPLSRAYDALSGRRKTAGGYAWRYTDGIGGAKNL